MKYEYEYELPIIQSIAKNYYNKETYEHASRVVTFVVTDPRVMLHERNFRYFCAALAICHDLLEDTELGLGENQRKYLMNAVGEELYEAIDIISWRKSDESYIDYCKRISARDSEYFMTDIELAAWYVKLADMKDHLTQTDTLTDELKKKYLEGMAYLL